MDQDFIKQIMYNQLEVAGQFDQMNQVIERSLKGETVTIIAKSLSLTRVQVENHIKNWKELAQNNNAIKARAKEALLGADEHFTMLISEAWDVVREAGSQGELGNKNSAIKLIADIEIKRIDMLRQAGLLENNELAEELLETERKQSIMISILKEVCCDKCRMEVAKKISEITGNVEAVIID